MNLASRLLAPLVLMVLLVLLLFSPQAHAKAVHGIQERSAENKPWWWPWWPERQPPQQCWFHNQPCLEGVLQHGGKAECSSRLETTTTPARSTYSTTITTTVTAMPTEFTTATTIVPGTAVTTEDVTDVVTATTTDIVTTIAYITDTVGTTVVTSFIPGPISSGMPVRRDNGNGPRPTPAACGCWEEYVSACSCLGVQPRTVTAHAPRPKTSTVTKTMTVQGAPRYITDATATVTSYATETVDSTTLQTTFATTQATVSVTDTVDVTATSTTVATAQPTVLIYVSSPYSSNNIYAQTANQGNGVGTVSLGSQGNATQFVYNDEGEFYANDGFSAGLPLSYVNGDSFVYSQYEGRNIQYLTCNIGSENTLECQDNHQSGMFYICENTIYIDNGAGNPTCADNGFHPVGLSALLVSD